MADLSLKLKLTADGRELAAEVRRDRDEITALGRAANDCGASLRGAFGSNNVTTLDAQRRGVRGVADELDRTRGAAASAQAMMVRFAAATGAALSVDQAIRYADAWKTVEARLKLVTSGTTELEAAQRRLFEIAQATRSSFEATAELYGRFARSTQQLGLSQEQLLRVTETVNKAVQVGGGSAESASAALLQLAQAMASGALRGDELNSVMEQAPRLAQAVAEGMGVSVGRLKAMGEAGALSTEAVVKALQKQAGVIDSEFGQLPATVGASLTNVQNAVLRWVGETDRALGATAAAANQLQQMAANFDAVAHAALLAGGAFATLAVARNAASGLEALRLRIDDVRVAAYAQQVATLEAANAEKVASGNDLLRAQSLRGVAAAAVSAAEAEALASLQALDNAKKAVAAAEMQVTLAKAKLATTTDIYALNIALRDETAALAVLGATQAEARVAQEAYAASTERLTATRLGLAKAEGVVASANQGLTNAHLSQAAATEALAGRVSLASLAMAGLRNVGSSLLAFVGGPIGAGVVALAGGLYLLSQRTTAAEDAAAAFGKAQEANRALMKGGAQGVAELANEYRALGTEMRAVTQLRIEEALSRQVDAVRALRMQGVDEVHRSPLLDTVEGNHGSDTLPSVQRFERMGLAAAQVEQLRAALRAFQQASAEDPEALVRLVGVLNEIGRSAGDAGKPVLDLARRLADPALKADELKTAMEQLKARLTLLVDPSNAAAQAILANGQAADGAAASLNRYGMAAGGVADKLAELSEKARILKLPVGFERRVGEVVGAPPEPKIPVVTGYSDRHGTEDDVAYQNWRSGEATARIVLSRTAKAESAEQVRLTQEAAKAAELLAQAQASGSPAAMASARANLAVAEALRDGVIVEADKASFKAAKLREFMAGVAGQAGEAATMTSLAARQTLALAAAYEQGGAAVAAQELANRIELETLRAGAGAHSELAQRIREEETARRKLMAAQSDRDMVMQTNAAKALALAERDGAKAVAEAQARNQAAIQVEKEGVAADSDRAKAIAEKIVALAKWQEQQAYNRESRQADNDLKLAQLELATLRESEPVRARILELARFELEIREKYPQLGEEDIQTLLRKKAVLIDTQQTIQRQKAAWGEIGQTLERAFEKVGDALVQAFVEGKRNAIDWGSLTRGIIASVVSDLIKMAAIRPFQNAVFGTSQPTLWDAFSGPSQSAQAGQQGGVVSLTNGAGQFMQLGQQAYNAYTGTNTLGTAATNFAYSGMGSALGLSMTGQTAAMAAGGTSATAAGVMGVPGGITAGTPVLTSTGSALASGASTIGAAMPYGMLGGMGGAWIGTMTNSRALAGVSGAAIGAGSAYIGSIMATGASMGPWGLVAAAVIAAVMAMIGTQKKSSGPWGLGYMNVENGVASPGYMHSDNGYPDENIRAMLTSASTLFNGMNQITGAKISDTYKNDDFAITNGAKDGVFNSIVAGVEKTFNSFEEALVDGMKRLQEKMIERGVVTYDNQSALKAIRNSKATTPEEFLKDVAAGTQWGQMSKIYAAGYNPMSEVLRAAYDAAKKESDTYKEQYVDYLRRVVDLQLTDEKTAKATMRRSFEDGLGLTTSNFQPLRGLDLVTEQVKIRFEALRGTMEALGYTAQEQQGLYTQMLTQATDAYNRMAGEVPRRGVIAVMRATNQNFRENASDYLKDVDLDPAKFVHFNENFQSFLDAANAGTATMANVSDIQGRLNWHLSNGRITADQYNAILTIVTETYVSGTQRLQQANQALRSGRLSIEQAIDPNRKLSANEMLQSLGLDPSTKPAFRAALDSYLTAVRGGTRDAAQLRDMEGRLTWQYQHGGITLEQYTQGVQMLTQEWQAGTQAAEQATQAQVQAAEAAVGSWGRVYDTMRAALANLRMDSKLSTLSARARVDEGYEQLLAAYTRFGSAANDNSRQQAADDINSMWRPYLEAAREYYADQPEYARREQEVETIQRAVRDYSRTQVDRAQQQIDILTGIRSGIDRIAASNDNGGSVSNPGRYWGAAGNVAANIRLATPVTLDGSTYRFDQDFGSGNFLNWVRAQPEPVKEIYRQRLRDAGQPDRIQFDTGAAFLGQGVYHRPTVFPAFEIAERRPEAVLPLANVGGTLGVHAVFPSSAPVDMAPVVAAIGGTTGAVMQIGRMLAERMDALAAEVEGLSAEVAEQRRGLRDLTTLLERRVA